MHANRQSIQGNRLVLAGAVMYLLEWLSIIPAGETGPVEPGTKSASQVLELYQQHPSGAAFIATWCSLVLLGRVLLVVGLRKALASVGADGPLMLWAMAAMAVSVAIELVGLASVAAGSSLAAHGASAEIVGALDTLAALLWLMIFAPLGLAVWLSAWSMLRSHAFAWWICGLGLIGGTVLMVGGAVSGPGIVESGFSRTAGGLAGIGVPFFWLWMLITGVVLYRRTGTSSVETTTTAGTEIRV